MSTAGRFKWLAAMVVVMVLMMAEGATAQTWDCGAALGTVTCALNEDGVFTVSGSGDMRGYDATIRDDNRPWGYVIYSITSVFIEEGVTSIGKRAFWGCGGLTFVRIPNSVASIEENAFLSCRNLTNIEISDGNTKYSSVDGVLFNKNKDTLLLYTAGKQGAYIIPNGVTSIRQEAFSGCTGLTSVTIPNSVTSIENAAFYACTSLTSVTIGNNVTEIGSGAFGNCTNLMSVISLRMIPTDINTNAFATGQCATSACYTYVYVWSSACLFVPESAIPDYRSTNGWKNFNCIKDTSEAGKWQTWDFGVTLGTVTATLSSEGTLTISGSGEIKGNSTSSWYNSRSSVTSVIIENGVTFRSGAFSGCTGLTSIEVGDGNTKYISVDGVLFNKAQDTLLQYPRGKQGAYSIPNSVTYIGGGTFSGCTGLTSITIPNSVTSIGGSAFSGCTGLTSITIPNSVISIGRSAFFGCTGLTSITIPNSVISIGDEAFAYCDGLTSVTIGNGVTSIGYDAFGTCTSLTNIEVSEGNAAYSSVDGVLFNKPQNTLLLYPAGKQGAYSIPNGVMSIGELAFADCQSMTSITIPNSVTSIGDWVFYNCTSLTSVTIPNGVTSIGEWAFAGCDNLASVTISNSVTYIGNMAFSYCYALTSVINLSEVPLNIEYLFDHNTSTTACLYVPEESISAYRSAEGWSEFSCVKSLDEYVSVASHDRVIPNGNTGEVAIVAPVSVLTGKFTAGPNPVGKSSDGIAFFWNGKHIKSGALTVYDASGNVVRKLAIKDNAVTGNTIKRAVGLWDLKDSKGRLVSDGTYLVKGRIAASGGKGERVSVVVGVR